MAIIMANVFPDSEPSTLLNTSEASHHKSPCVGVVRQLLFIISSASQMTKPRLEFCGLPMVGLRVGAQVSGLGALRLTTEVQLPQVLWAFQVLILAKVL